MEQLHGTIFFHCKVLMIIAVGYTSSNVDVCRKNCSERKKNFFYEYDNKLLQ
jgi:hypothetical protein